jgi:hypothetical protein
LRNWSRNKSGFEALFISGGLLVCHHHGVPGRM